MDPLISSLLGALVALVVAGPLGFLAARFLDRARQSSAKTKAAELTAQAKREADNILKDSELRAKDELFKKREQFNREAEQSRTELREQERRLEKREDVALQGLHFRSLIR